MTVNGDLAFNNFGNNYRLIGIMFHHTGAFDFKDEKDVSKSGLYDIQKGYIQIMIPWNEKFLEEKINGLHGTNFVLIALPKQVGYSDIKVISSIRDSLNIGGIMLESRSKNP